MQRFCLGLSLLVGVLGWKLAATAVERPLSEKIRFNRDVRPIFSDTCFKCHGPDSKARKAKLRLDVRENAVAEHESGLPIVPRDRAKSEVWKRITTSDPDDHMPPAESNKSLTPQQIEIIGKWIDQGAEYEPHWAYTKLVRPPLPKVQGQKSKIKSPIDHFILASLDARGIKPSPEADKRMLLRRLSLDLIGLPPTPEEMDAFLRDRSDKSYERAVDRLLASPHFGEVMAAGWLDLVRYADTVGYHGDQGQNIFPYRDYVIDSFNANKPFDQFTLEQIAGDLLPNPTQEQRIATGFNRLNMMTREGGAQPAEYLAKYGADRVRTIATAWLGSTMGCCECHDHKFDPFSTRDFYAMKAFFADLREWGVYQDYNYTPNPDLRGWSNDHPFPPEISVESTSLQRRTRRIQEEARDIAVKATVSLAKMGTHTPSRADSRASRESPGLATDEASAADFDAWKTESLAFLHKYPAGWQPAASAKLSDAAKQAKAQAVLQGDGSILFSGGADETTEFQFPLAGGWLSAIRVELIPDETHKGGALRDSAKTTTITPVATITRPGKQPRRLSFFFGEADHKNERYFNGSAILGVTQSWMTSTADWKKPQTAVWLLKNPVRVADGETLTILLGSKTLGRVRVSATPFAAPILFDAGIGKPLMDALNSKRPTAAQLALIHQTYVLNTDYDPNVREELHRLQIELAECRGGRAMTMVTVAVKPKPTRVLPRGNWQDESGELVEPAPPGFLPQPPKPADSGRPTRLDLVKWLVSKENPLPARAFANRLWKQFFGAGLSGVVDDLGLQGDPPSHPELLDWLAVEFRDSGWNVKRVVKIIVLSATYRQSANLRPELRDLDPNNRLLASQNPRRLEAEAVRDNALAIAGLINLEIGGPSARPYQPPKYYEALQFPDREYQPDKDERQYRRGVYVWWQRTFLQPMLANFDAPGREECQAFRFVSNTPQQALTLLNDPTFVEASRVFAANALAAKVKSDSDRLDWIYQRALLRPVKPKERDSLLKFLAEQRSYYKATPDDADQLLGVGLAPLPKLVGENTDVAELSAWTQVCRVVLNLHETITKY